MKASAEVANEKSELATAVTGGVRGENPVNGVGAAGEDALNEGLADQVSEDKNEEKVMAECHQEEMNSSEKTEEKIKASDQEPKSECVLHEKGDQLSNEESQSVRTDGVNASLVTNGEIQSAVNGTGEEMVMNDQLEKARFTGEESIEENVVLGSTKKDLEQNTKTTDDQSGKSMADEESRNLTTNEGSELAEVNGEEGSHVEVTG